jgi:nucleotide-binding universal stress UspA family protein
MAIERSGPVVVGVDGSPASMAAVDLAAAEAMARVTPLLVVHAHDAAPDSGDRMLPLRRLVEVAVGRARAEHPGLSVAADLVRGDPVDILVDQSRGACLLVVGHPTGRGTGRSVAARVAARAAVPVLVNRALDAHGCAPRPVVVGIEGLSGSDPLLAFGFAEAALRAAPLLALHVWAAPADSYPYGMGPDGHHSGQARADAERLLEDAVSVWSEKYPDVVVHRAVRHCLDAAVALSAASRSAQLVVVGAPDPPPGPVLPVLLHRAGCPVVAVPAR